jgi:putative endonuclease
MKAPAVYMLASEHNGTLYIGVTSDLIKRVWQHKESLAEGFTKKYGVKILVWYKQHETMESAIAKEKAMKKWLRKWKLATIEKTNPNWQDLWPEIIGTVVPANAGIQSPDNNTPVVLANAGTQQNNNALDLSNPLDSRIRGNDGSLGGAR